jgi:hypothetical protein
MSCNRLIASLALLIFALCVVSVQAQSGRRQNTPAPAAPVPTPTPEPAPPPKKPENESELVILVASDRMSGANWIPFSYYSAAQQGCADRLRSQASIDVDVSERDMTRSDGIKKAKSQSKTYVLLLSIQQDTMGRNNDLELDFTLFEPSTAKVVITGRSYSNQYRSGPVVLGRSTSSLYLERFFKQAGGDIADKIVKKLHLGR